MDCPTVANTYGSALYYVTGTPRQKKKKKKAHRKEQIKSPEKIQLSNEEIPNLSDAEFKTLVIRMLTELVEYDRKTGKSEGYEK